MTLEEILRRAEIERKLRSTSSESYELKGALRDYEVLSNSSLSMQEKAERLGLSKDFVRKEIYALRRYKLLNFEEIKKYRTMLRLQT